MGESLPGKRAATAPCGCSGPAAAAAGCGTRRLLLGIPPVCGGRVVTCPWCVRRPGPTSPFPGGSHAQDRGDHQAVQARRGEGGPPRDRRPGHDGHRGEGLRPPEGPHGALPRRRVRRRLPAEDQGRDRRPDDLVGQGRRRDRRGAPTPGRIGDGKIFVHPDRGGRSASAPASAARTRSSASRSARSRPSSSGTRTARGPTMHRESRGKPG